jgi:hypothetical protein
MSGTEPSAMMNVDECDPDMHHRAFFSFEPSLLLGDLGNIVSLLLLLCTNSTFQLDGSCTCSSADVFCLQALDYSISGIHQLER